MAEILALIAIVLAITTMNRNRKIVSKFAEEIQELRRELATLTSGEVIPAVPQAAVSIAADTAVGGAAEAGEIPGPWSTAKDGEVRQSQAEVATNEEAVSTSDAVLAAAGQTSKRESLESRIGARWAVWVGGLALALGGVFMVKYAIESGLLSPAVRLSLAALFGLVLIAAGELVRRRAQPVIANAFQNAMIPGILTAAGALTLFGVTYAAHGFYGYFGTAAAFVLLALIALATIALSLLHGQALAGFGLLGSMATPLLVSAPEPDPWRLFGYLSITWFATLTASRLRHWQTVPMLANAGLMLWSIIYLAAADTVLTLPVTLAVIVMLAGIGVVWPGKATVAGSTEQEVRGADAPVDPASANEENAEKASAAVPERSADTRWRRIFAPDWVLISLSAAFATIIPAIILAFLHPLPPSAAMAFVVLVLALAAVGAGRSWASYPAMLSGLCALAGAMVLAGLSADKFFAVLAQSATFDAAVATPVAGGAAPDSLLFLLAAGLALAGAAAIRLWKARAASYASLWSVLMALFPVAVTAVSFMAFGNLSFDLKHGLFALVFGLAYLAEAEVFSRNVALADTVRIPQWALVSGGFSFLVLALFALTDGLATTLLIALLGLAMVYATRLRNWPVLPWMMIAAAAVVAIRIGWEPTVVGQAQLSKTPVFNQLLAGYGVPAILLAISAYELRNWPGERVRNLLQALASLFVLLAVAILVRHAMNGGVLDSAVPSLGEQAIYTMLVAGASAVMMTLDLKSPSPIFRYGSMVLGTMSMLSILSAHFFALNPYFTGEMTGRWPFFNLLLVGYLLPGLAFAGLAWYARGKRPAAYVTLLALTGAALVFAWLTLSVRRYWHGEGIADWKGFLQGETYTYSVVWLLLGVGLLALGSRFDAKSLRLASAALVLIAVVKVFLVDMSNLEGILRALSFIGLGAVLIGIGLFYQRILSGRMGEQNSRERLHNGGQTS